MDPAGSADDRSLRLLLPEPVRTLPADLVAVLVGTAIACAFVLVPVLNETPLRVIFGLPLVLFVPGYALIAALFPEAGRPPGEESGDGVEQADSGDSETTATSAGGTEDSDDTDDGRFGTLAAGGRDRGIDGIERAALSFGLSIAVVPLIGLALNFTPWGIRLIPVLVSLVAFVLIMTAVATVRRRRLPAEERFRVPYRTWLARGRAGLFNPDSRLDGVLNVLLVASILLAVGALVFAIAVPPQGETFTEFYLLTEDEEGDLVAANYPTEFTVGEGQPVVVGIGNQEHEAMDYTVVAQLQAVETTGNESTVRERVEIDRFDSPTLAHNDTWHETREIVPTMTGEDLRVQYLLYRESVPAEPTVDTAYRDVHLWIDVASGE